MQTTSAVWMVYATAANRAEAERLAGALIEAKAAACVNILGPITSIYEWKGQVERSEEYALIAKTTEAGWPDVERIMRAHHSYECPCMVAWPLGAGHAPFLDWVRGQVRAG